MKTLNNNASSAQKMQFYPNIGKQFKFRLRNCCTKIRLLYCVMQSISLLFQSLFRGSPTSRVRFANATTQTWFKLDCATIRENCCCSQALERKETLSFLPPSSPVF